MKYKNKIDQAVILAGGRGERLRPFTDANPKPMYPINGVPFIEYLIKQIHSFGINNILILLGYMPDKIIEYLGDGKRYGLNIRYKITPVEYETGKRMKDAYDLLQDNFLMMYCDNYCPINYEEVVNSYYNNNAEIQLSVYTNKDKYTKDNLKINNGKIEIYDKKREKDGLLGVDIGYAIISKNVIRYLNEENNNFEATIYPMLIENDKLFGTLCEHRYYSIGSIERMQLTTNFFSNTKYIFLDREGTINKRPGKGEYITRVEDFIWLDGAKEAIKLLTDNQYNVIIITNQAGIARGMLNINDFNLIQEKMYKDIENVGSKILDTFFCPHGWDDGCDCRKPKPGLLYDAQKKYNMDLTKCIYIGDDERDMITAKNANMHGIQVNDEYKLYDAVNDVLRRER